MSTGRDFRETMTDCTLVLLLHCLKTYAILPVWGYQVKIFALMKAFNDGERRLKGTCRTALKARALLAPMLARKPKPWKEGSKPAEIMMPSITGTRVAYVSGCSVVPKSRNAMPAVMAGVIAPMACRHGCPHDYPILMASMHLQ